MRLFKIAPETTDVFFAPDGGRLAAPSDLAGEVVVQSLEPGLKGRLPREQRLAVGAGAALAGWEDAATLRLIVAGGEGEGAQIVSRPLFGRVTRGRPLPAELAASAAVVVDAAGRFAAPAEGARQIALAEIGTGRSSTWIARQRASRIAVHRIAAAGVVLSERAPKERFGTVHLVDPVRARSVYEVARALTLVPLGTDQALVLASDEEGRSLRAELRRLRPDAPPAVNDLQEVCPGDVLAIHVDLAIIWVQDP